MIIELSKEFYELAKTVDYTELGDHIKFVDEKNKIILDDCDIQIENYKGDFFPLAAIWAFLDCITTEIDMTGLSDDQNKVLPRGRQLYALHDGIYYSLPVKEDE